MSIYSQMVLRQNLTRILTNPEMDGNLALLAQTIDALIDGSTQAGDAAQLGGETTAELMALPAWIVPTLLNGFQEAYSVGYTKDRFGLIHLKGVVTGGTGNNPTVFMLPAGYRPPCMKVLPIGWSNGSAWVSQACLIYSSGEVIVYGSILSYQYFSFDGISFSTD